MADLILSITDSMSCRMQSQMEAISCRTASNALAAACRMSPQALLSQLDSFWTLSVAAA
ncbi:MAG TPA: hypothetical protein VFQ68_16325 [Streptosporangiaceae bacterium]|nr:hypothetical protein [Streptosporangiaceae bacterium]